MFDPTAFDNMKVVFEGAVYDLDLSGEAIVTQRHDYIDLATMSRLYSIRLTLDENSSTYADIRLEATIEQLAAELLNQANQFRIGAFVKVLFTWKQEEKSASYKKLITSLWGEERSYEYRTIFSSHEDPKEEIIIDFQRIVTEDMMDDLLEMLHHVVKTLQKLY
ncbi:hypothetical protein G4D61_10360 [Bacillus ginsengihumi]|uniref:Uncharacterized protein n=1 Tax=Heyndrickxia ginsengihumi TaxID=363870 RepID=A0A0A6VF16_9BACI|nr:hypothetical protein [Heyndrickxia ginsengihumi]KHD86063.1 hypothetical protein NG54_05445 [Heyndrickxia ginsengihumi]MBE6184218.1 hypothetical protein [Bacillus sp. (in: firmicutes)]NEY20358.1 hypothetical protein [Heyndrickxia ginsengihumi]